MIWNVPLSKIEFGDEEIHAILEVLQSGWVSIGEQFSLFEQHIAERLIFIQAFSVTNCTTALHLAFASLDIDAGDEVILPFLTDDASANSILYTGATPVFADITDQEDLTISPDHIEKLIAPRIRAIAVMQYGVTSEQWMQSFCLRENMTLVSLKTQLMLSVQLTKVKWLELLVMSAVLISSLSYQIALIVMYSFRDYRRRVFKLACTTRQFTYLNANRSCFRFHEGMLPKTEYASQHLVTLPLYPTMSNEQVDWIITNVIDLIGNNRKYS